MVAVSESVGLNTKVRMSFRKSYSSRKSSSCQESESAIVTSIHLSADDMSRVLDRDQRTVFAPFNKNSTSKNRRLGAPPSASVSSRVTPDGNTSRHVIHHPVEITATSPSLSPSSVSTLSTNLSYPQKSTVDGKTVSDDCKLLPDSCQNLSHQRHSSTSTSCHQRSSSFVSKLVGVLTVSACVLSLVNLPNTTAAPMSERLPRNVDDDIPFWTDPCQIGLAYPEEGVDSGSYYGLLDLMSNRAIITTITVTSQMAIHHYQSFIEDYVTETFEVSLADHLKEWESTDGYPWLPRTQQIPKKLKETLPEEFKDNLELSKALQDSYEYLQRVAVGMEVVAKDHDFRKSKFVKDFKNALDELRTVLCEVNTVMSNFKVERKPDIQRSIMPDKIRKLTDLTDRHIRDWLIFRDYMNVMEFVAEVFNHLLEKEQYAPLSS